MGCRWSRVQISPPRPNFLSSVPGKAVEEAAAARGAGLGAQRPAARERVVDLHQVGCDGAEALLVAEIEAVGDALAEGEHAVLQLARAAERYFVEPEALRDAPVKRHAVAAREQGTGRRLQ